MHGVPLLQKHPGPLPRGARTLFTEYTYSDISINIMLQIKKEGSCFLSISIYNPPFSMLRISAKLKVLARFSHGPVRLRNKAFQSEAVIIYCKG